MTIKHSRTRAVTSVCHTTDRPEDTYLMQVIDIVCEACEGHVTYQMTGHHIPVILRILQQVMTQYPDLCRETIMEVPTDVNLVIPPRGGRPS